MQTTIGRSATTMAKLTLRKFSSRICNDYWRLTYDYIFRWPRLKKAFTDTGIQIHGAIECMYLSLYDKAGPASSRIDQVRSTKNPESYAWFAVANYMSTVGSAHQDWSTGACRDKGAEFMTVTVTRGASIPKRTAPILSPREPMAYAESSIFTA